LMRVGAIRKTARPDFSYVRSTEWIAPFYCYIATGPHESRLFKAWQPIDDFSCYTFYIHFDPEKPIDREAVYANWGHRTEPPDYMTVHNVGNMHLQDRERMKRGNFSGVEGAAIQDRAVQESMGPIIDRTKEHLGTSDKAVIFYRRLLLQKLKEMEEGNATLPGLDPALDYDQRACSFEIPNNVAWQDVVKWQECHEQRQPQVAAE
jgi:phthalate 4,5-dioxygenase